MKGLGLTVVAVLSLAACDPGTPHVALIYEYACHEGNKSMYGILGGARAAERQAAEAAK